ncbi:MAG: DUF983 domain-containing protein [Bacteroidetes bacterium]|nr:DUF983 domain-containing protein [Bacteroidota bacterium]
MNLYSILANKCPKCTKGNFFITNNPYNLSKFDKMNSKCSECNENFEREPGFYYGAMYASYGLTVGLGIAMFLFFVLVLKLDIITFLIIFSLSLVVLMPWLFRTSRLLWINLFVKRKSK